MDVKAVRSFAATFVTDTTNPPTPRNPRLRRGRFDLVEVADVITALICFAVANAALTAANVGTHHPTGLLVLLAFFTCAPLALRTRFPLTAWAVCALAIIGASLAIQANVLVSNGYLTVAVIVYGLCLYAVTVRCRPRITVAATAVTLAWAAFFDPGSTVVALFLTAVPLLLGAVVRQRRSGERQLAEQERRHSGERALLEERQRIARELHDVVAHHMSVIAIQAEAAPYKMDDPPPELVESFADIRASALAGLTELRRVLGVLRTGEQDTAPQPGLADLDALLDSARSGGVSVAATRSGDPVTLPGGVELSAYRIVQEALSNAMRHAPGSHVQVQVAYRPEGLALEVRNDAGRHPAAPPETVPAAAANENRNGAGGAPVRACDGHASGGDDAFVGGHGIIGMRERAAMLGGSLDASPTDDGGFRVAAVLPSSHDGHGDAA
jgi:signal transduction histidine kinase